ncbi:MAG: hypothetical protein ACODAJ_03615 [Planctomycetota bacterium]
MKGRTQLWLGSVMLALAVGLLLSSTLFTRPGYAQNSGPGEGRTRRYVMVTGIRGSAANTQTVYVVDDVNQIVYAFEYHSRAKEMRYRAHSDIYLYSSRLIEGRRESERRGR